MSAPTDVDRVVDPFALLAPAPQRPRMWTRWLRQKAADRRTLLLTGGGKLAVGKPYAEKQERSPGLHDRAAEALLAATVKPALSLLRDPAEALRLIVNEVGRHDATLRAATDADLASLARGMRGRLRRDGFTPAIVGECFALVTEAASRTLGMRHFPVQLMAGWALLQGRLVEMATGEGKTFAATLPAATVALAGYPVHVITVNDYLASRDAQEMGPLYRFLGLTVGTVSESTKRADRRRFYGCSIVYATNKDIAFDYLRDGVAMARRTSRLHLALARLKAGQAQPPDLVLRGLYFGIVDEADSVFIDEARTPLILSAQVGPAEAQEESEQAIAIARTLVELEDFIVEVADRHVTLTERGKDAIEARCAGMDGVWTSSRAREEVVTQALAAVNLYRRDQHYVVADGKVQIVDEATGRLMPDRAWERGLHQLVEVKEGCEPTERRETIARMTYQRLFSRYILLGGMTGTAAEVSPEIRRVYGLDIVRVPLNLPSQRHSAKSVVCSTRSRKWDLLVEIVEREAIQAGRPVLIGTRSVGASQEISAVLHACGIEHALLNAMQDQAEAEIIAAAGQPGIVTVATNMAGRGTDIRLGPGVAERGGLHVVLTEYHESRRVDRQLFGRAARQGDPGSCQAIVSLEDELFGFDLPGLTRIVRGLVERGWPVPGVVFRVMKWLAQGAAEGRGSLLRAQNLRDDIRVDRVLAFSGRGE